jgi:uncharacterized membrane protein
MTKTRLEAFSDGVIAIIITIMVLELRIPEGSDWAALRPLLPELLVYVLSFAYLGIYWNNHHHMLHATHHITGKVLWPNLHLLFWLSLIPVGTAWLGHHPSDAVPAAVYGVVLLMCAVAWMILQGTIVRLQGPDSMLARALGADAKAKASLVLYVAAPLLAFVHPWISIAIYIAVALIWLVPDRRIEARLERT